MVDLHGVRRVTTTIIWLTKPNLEELVSHRLLDGRVLLIVATSSLHIAHELTKMVDSIVVHMVLPL